MGKLGQRVAVVTGAARGIGRQIARCFAAEEASIVLGDIRTAEMEATAQEIKKLGRAVITVKTDVSQKKEVERLIKAAIDRFGRIDILVNDAGISRRASLLEMSEEEWDEVLNVNLKGVFLCTQAVARQMIEQKYGKVINLASVGGLGSKQPDMANYQASKAGVIQLTKSAARELSPYGINVNAIAPGTIETDILYDSRTPEQVKEFLESSRKVNLLGRVGTPQDIANLALFLASDDSSYITGQVIVADGGRADRL
ncbi:MAG: glucose 1-dehydrogenase [Chloroflexota bacterium]